MGVGGGVEKLLANICGARGWFSDFLKNTPANLFLGSDSKYSISALGKSFWNQWGWGGGGYDGDMMSLMTSYEVKTECFRKIDVLSKFFDRSGK